ncbi:MAG: NAD(P)/FAD-dependent oxidoreductase [Lautropia sp.]
MPSAPDGGSVVIVGAGIIGLSVALRLQMDGMDVTVIDAREPMSGCSSGNAGYLSEANIFPPAAWDMLRRLPGLLFSRAGALAVRPSYLPRLMPWAIRALRVSAAGTAGHIQRSMAGLLTEAIAAFDELLDAAGARHLVDRNGSLLVYQTAAALSAKARLLPGWNALGVRAEAVTARTMRAMEPALTPDMAGGICFPNAGRCLDPRALGLLYFDRFLRGGGTFVSGQVTEIIPGSDQVAARLSGGRDVRASRLVACTGFEPGPLQALLPFRLPLASERGYHLMLPHPGVRLSRPVVFGEPLFAATTMVEGLRLAGTAEFACAKSPAAMAHAHRLLPLARKFLPHLDGNDAVPWMGVRPSLPDGMPAIGVLVSHPRILYAVGHAHNGLTTSAITARCISAVIAGRATPIDLIPFAIERFTRRPAASRPSS